MVSWQIDRYESLSKTMQSLGVAIRWQIARYDHAKPKHGAAMAWRLAVRYPDTCITHESPCFSHVRLESNHYFAVLFVRPSEGPTRSPLYGGEESGHCLCLGNKPPAGVELFGWSCKSLPVGTGINVLFFGTAEMPGAAGVSSVSLWSLGWKMGLRTIILRVHLWNCSRLSRR